MSQAISDRESGEPVHFDCALERIGKAEILDKGDVLSYIGGGRFGIVHYTNPQDPKSFSIKKIIEWEVKETRAEWRGAIGERYSVI
jgi:hypothetical protein